MAGRIDRLRDRRDGRFVDAGYDRRAFGDAHLYATTAAAVGGGRYRDALAECVPGGAKRSQLPGGQEVRSARTAAKVTYTLNAVARVRFTVQQSRPGRKGQHGKKTTCDRPTKKNATKKKCTRIGHAEGELHPQRRRRHEQVPLHRAASAASASRRGSYRLVATPTANGKTGRPTSASFSIIPERPAPLGRTARAPHRRAATEDRQDRAGAECNGSSTGQQTNAQPPAASHVGLAMAALGPHPIVLGGLAGPHSSRVPSPRWDLRRTRGRRADVAWQGRGHRFESGRGLLNKRQARGVFSARSPCAWKKMAGAAV